MNEIKFTDKTKAKKIIDIVLVCAIFALCVVTVVATTSQDEKSEEISEVTNISETPADDKLYSDVGDNSNISDIDEKMSDTQNDSMADKEDAVPDNEAIQSATQSHEKPALPPEFMLPLEGEIIREFSIDKPIYNSTMDDWRIHTGLDISSEGGTDVVASESGTVKFAGFDAKLGYAVIIERGEYECVYASLESNIPVSEGQAVSKGEIIGRIASSMISEICDKPHLHFEVKINSEYADPKNILNI